MKLYTTLIISFLFLKPTTAIVTHALTDEKQDTLTNLSIPAKDTIIVANNYKLGEVIVHGTLFEDKLTKVAGSISLLQHDELEKGDQLSLADYLGQVPGVFIQQGAYNTNRVIIRGIGSRTPYSSNRIRVYLDEIPLTSGEGVSSIEDIDMSLVERAEVIRGPSGALYGSGLGGTIRLFTRYPETGSHELNTKAEIASFGTYRLTINGFKRSTQTLVSSDVNYTHSDGYRQNNKFDRASGFLNIRHFSEHASMQFLLLYVHLDAQIPSSLDSAIFETNPRAAAAKWLAKRGYESYNKLLAGLNYTNRLNDHWENTVSLFSTYMDKYERSSFDILDDGSINAGVRNRLKFNGEKLRFILGIEGVTEKYPSKDYSLNGLEKGNLKSDYIETSSYANISLLNEWSASAQLNISTGINFNFLRYTLKNNGDSLSKMIYGYDPVISPRIGINYQLLQGLVVYSSFGHGFSAPSYQEALLPDGVPNPNLKSESGWNLDAGIRISSPDKRFFADVKLYRIWLYNLLVTKRISDSIFYGINAGRSSLQGIEMEWRYRVAGAPASTTNYLELNFSGVISKNHFTDFIDDTNDYSGKELPGIPDNEINAGITANLIKHFNIAVNITHTGTQFMNDDNSLTAKSWNVVNTELAYQSKEFHSFWFNVKCGIRNLLDEKYAAMILVNAPSVNSAPRRYYYPGLARNFYLGISISLK